MDRSTALAARRYGIILSWVTIPLCWLFIDGPSLWVYATGTVTRAHVDRCDVRSIGRSGSTDICYGSWNIDGTRRSGKIDGIRDDDYLGEDVRVRVTGSRATTRALRSELNTAGIALVLAVAVSIYVWIRFTLMARTATGNRSGHP